MLSATQLAALQAAATRTLDLAGCVIQRKSVTGSSYGTDEEAWAPVGAAVNAGMSEPTRTQLALYAGIIGSQRAWVVSLPYGTPVARDDRLLIAGRTLRVQEDLSLGSYSTLYQVLATEAL